MERKIKERKKEIQKMDRKKERKNGKKDKRKKERKKDKKQKEKERKPDMELSTTLECRATAKKREEAQFLIVLSVLVRTFFEIATGHIQ